MRHPSYDHRVTAAAVLTISPFVNLSSDFFSSIIHELETPLNANPNSGTVDSFGLGLPIAKQLVESQGGSIEMKSEIGKGTQVVLKFPYLM